MTIGSLVSLMHKQDSHLLCLLVGFHLREDVLQFIPHVTTCSNYTYCNVITLPLAQGKHPNLGHGKGVASLSQTKVSLGTSQLALELS